MGGFLVARIACDHAVLVEEVKVAPALYVPVHGISIKVSGVEGPWMFPLDELGLEYGAQLSRFPGRDKPSSGCSSAWLERLVWDQEVVGPNPITPTIKTRGTWTVDGSVSWKLPAVFFGRAQRLAVLPTLDTNARQSFHPMLSRHSTNKRYGS